MNHEIEPFTINVSQDQLDDLTGRLERTRWPDEETTVGRDEPWNEGMPRTYAQKLAAHWLAEYDWRQVESRLNSFPQFRTEIDGLGIHFLTRPTRSISWCRRSPATGGRTNPVKPDGASGASPPLGNKSCCDSATSVSVPKVGTGAR